MLGHTLLGCCSHHVAKAHDDCPPACACSGTQPKSIAASCQCVHHAHDRASKCNESHCVYMKDEKRENQPHFTPVPATQPQIGSLNELALRVSAGAPVAGVPTATRHLLFRVLLI